MGTEFEGLGFVPGVVRGTRSFNIDKLGRLRGISYSQIWTPGENEAVCRNYQGDYYGLQAAAASMNYYGLQAAAASMNYYGLQAAAASMNTLAAHILGTAGGPYAYSKVGYIANPQAVPKTNQNIITSYFWHDQATNAYYDSLGNMIATDESIANALPDATPTKDSKWSKKGKKLVGPKPEAYAADDFDILEEKHRLEEEKRREEEERRLEAERQAREREEKRKNHGMDDCKHGFYAYYEGSNDYGRDDNVSAVAEGYGETIIGTRGFRSMKARIVALHFGEDVTYNQRTMIRRNYPLIPVFDSFDKMVSEFPSEDGGMGKQPITPENTPDFWNIEEY